MTETITKPGAFKKLNPILVLRRAKCWTQLELAEKLGCTQQQVCYWERGDNIPGKVMFKKLCKLFGKEPESFMVELMAFEPEEK